MQLANNTNVINRKVDELASALGGLTIGGEVRQAIDGRPAEGPHALPSAQACSTCAPALVKLLDCRVYIDVDVCATALVFVYHYKYLFKGPDHASFTVQRRCWGPPKR
jgi:hypothetical protein